MKTQFQTLVDDQIRNNKYYQTQPEDFRFIIFSGDASTSEFEKIRAAIKEVIPEFLNIIKNSIDPAWVAAIGSARRWKELKHRDSHNLFDFQRIEGDDKADVDNAYHQSHQEHSELWVFMGHNATAYIPKWGSGILI